jgi:hypothetical protein
MTALDASAVAALLREFGQEARSAAATRKKSSQNFSQNRAVIVAASVPRPDAAFLEHGQSQSEESFSRGPQKEIRRQLIALFPAQPLASALLIFKD